MRLDLRFERTARGHLFLAGKSICVGGQLNFIARSSVEIGVEVLEVFGFSSGALTSERQQQDVHCELQHCKVRKRERVTSLSQQHESFQHVTLSDRDF